MTLKETVYEQLYEEIVTGGYHQNEVITESSLIAKYQVSKPPIREALVELCKEGVLQNMPRMGYLVVPVSFKEVLDLLDFRVDIEIAGLKHTFDNLNKGNLLNLSAFAMISDKEIQNPIWEKNQIFHLKLYELNGNNYGYQELKCILRKNRRYLSQFFQNEWKRASMQTKEYHTEILEALKREDLENASKFLKADIYSIKEEILKNI